MTHTIRTIQLLNDKIASLENELAKARHDVECIIRNCNHQWTDPIANNIYEPAYTIPGDSPGTMGIDWRGPVHVEAKTTKRWKRTCNICGTVQYTSNVQEQKIEVPQF